MHNYMRTYVCIYIQLRKLNLQVKESYARVLVSEPNKTKATSNKIFHCDCYAFCAHCSAYNSLNFYVLFPTIHIVSHNMGEHHLYRKFYYFHT